MDVERHEVAHADPHEIARTPGRHVDHAGFGQRPVELGDGPECLRELVSAAQRVQKRRVHRVHAVVFHLEPVARHHELRRRHQPVARHVVAVVDRECGTSIRRPQIDEHEARELVRRIGALPDALLEPTARRLSRSFQAPSVDVVDPAVIAAADASLERDPELERRPAMRAVQVQHADAPTAVAEDHEILAQHSHPQWRGGEISRERHRVPEPAQILAARCPGADLGQLRVGRRDVAAMIAVEGTGLLLRGARSSSLHGTPSLAPRSGGSQVAERIGA